MPNLAWLACLGTLIGLASTVRAADCKTATVGSPYSTCFDIYTNAGLTAAQFATDNPGLDCSKIQPGQKVCISAGTLPSNAPHASPNGTCYEYFVVPNDSCSSIAVKFDITVAQIEQFNAKTYKWLGCTNLQLGLTMCVSSGTPPPIPVNPDLDCGPESQGNATCPLKACCSAFGFCGLTDEFCHTSSPNPCISNCFTPVLPSCATNRSMRKMGYYAGWANRRPCGISNPNNFNWSGYTHAHFAFAVISQSSQIQLASADVPLLQQLVAQKTSNPSMKVLIAVGGWDFSQDDPTRSIFSVTISTAAKRAVFIASVKTFLTTYGLDGIDIDFEYPGAIERDAPATDTPNLTALFQELRTALGSSVIISCATPAGYWFVKGFEIDKIAGSVDYLNMMSYDYHGQWDTNITDQPSVTNPHTSLLDIQASAQLYARAGIDFSKVNLGLAWYGRTYHLANSACKGYNCTMVGGGSPGPCSSASGYLTQFEITDMLADGITPTLDRTSETYWFNKGGDLVTFDQADTWAVKQNYAASTCFGGTFVWSVDQVLENGNGGSGGAEGSGGIQSYTVIPWNPNPHPSTGAPSETFVGGGSTVVVAIPTATTFITVGGAIITLNSGGTPVNGLLPKTVSELNVVTPTWTYNILPPTSVPSITFTVPISGTVPFSTVVPSPTRGAAITITGLASESWTLTAGPSGASIIGTLPTDVGISGGLTPTATPPRGWLGPWTDPVAPHTIRTMQPVQSNTEVTWNPNPFPPPTATVETFICSGTTTSFPIPTASTTVSAGGATIVLNAGGTPVNGPLASQCTEVGGIFPTWSQDIIPPPDAQTITFTGPLTLTPTWVTTVPVPPKSDSPEATVIGPPGDHNRCNTLNVWSLLFGGFLHPCLPLDVGIIGGITPVPIPPPGWSGPWTNPIPRPTPPPSGESEPTSASSASSHTTTASSSSSSSVSGAACPTRPASLDLPDEPENADWDADGTDPDRRRAFPKKPRRINIQRCKNPDGTDMDQYSPDIVELEDGHYFTLDPLGDPWETELVDEDVDGKPTVAGETNQEHVFELGYISQFVGAPPVFKGAPGINTADCTWIRANFFDYQRADGSTMGEALVGAIDTIDNMVWVDKPLNQAKSNVVNQNTIDADNPPYQAQMDFLRLNPVRFNNPQDAAIIYSTEDFLRHLAALGQYFQSTASTFRKTAIKVQTLLSEITPSSVRVDDASLPLIFYTWLGTLLSDYPNGCTSRGQNAWDYYLETMEMISTRTNEPVPDCFPLYDHGQYNPSSFNPHPLMPPAPQSPQCNVPGTVGTVVYVQSVPAGALAPVGIMPYGVNGAVKIMGSGSPDFYAVGSGPSISGTHVQGRALDSAQYPGCSGSYLFDDVAKNTAGYSTAEIQFSCNGPGGQQNVAINFRMGGQAIPNCILVRKDGNSPWKALCSPTSNAMQSCSTSFILLNGLSRRESEIEKRLDPLTLSISALGFAGPGGL